MDHDYRVVRRGEERRLGREGKGEGRMGEEKERDLNDLSGFPIEKARLRSLRESISFFHMWDGEHFVDVHFWGSVRFYRVHSVCDNLRLDPQLQSLPRRSPHLPVL